MLNKTSYDDVLTSLKSKGIHQFGAIIDRESASSLYKTAIEKRSFGPNIFLSETEYNVNPQHFGVNPRPGFNFLEQFNDELAFIESDQYLSGILVGLLGEGYSIHNKKFVCGIPDNWIPQWLATKMKEASINNLGAYIKPEYRDITYFHGIDFHQDIIDWPSWPPEKKTHEFLTLYIYIHDVTEEDAPLIALPETHIYGASYFPHDLTNKNNRIWIYKDNNGHSLESQSVILTGDTGYAAIWHSCLLHGTQAISNAKNMRLSLRYILRRSVGTSSVGIDEVNSLIDGPLYLPSTRNDLDSKGRVVLNKNHINSKDKEEE